MNISYEKAALKAYAAREIENVMNRYEYMMSHDQFQYVYDNLFALDKEDVFFEVPFGRWNGRESLKRVIIGYHSSLCCDAEGNPRPGVIFYNANTQAIIEVADDLKTAKGLWVCPGYSAKDLPDGSYDCGAGTAVRACDFIYDEKMAAGRCGTMPSADLLPTPIAYRLQNSMETSNRRPYAFSLRELSRTKVLITFGCMTHRAQSTTIPSFRSLMRHGMTP